MKVTLKDLAEKVDCDISTVSRVLNDKPNRISQVKRDEILKTAREMDYVTNRNASNLASGKTRTIGILVRNITDSVFAEYIEKIDRYMMSKNYSVVQFITYNNLERDRQCLMNLQSHQVDAMICLHYIQENENFYKMLQREGYVLTFRGVDITSDNIDFDTTLIDIRSAYYYLTNHLFDVQCRNIGVVGGYIADEIASGKNEYSASFELAHKEAGVEFSSRQGIRCKDSQDDAYAAIVEVFGKNPKCFDGLIVQNAHKVLGVYKALCDLGLRVPEDIKLCTVSDLDICRMLPVPITVWAQPVDDICLALTELTLNRLKYPESAITKIPFKSRLVIRKSTEC